MLVDLAGFRVYFKKSLAFVPIVIAHHPFGFIAVQIIVSTFNQHFIHVKVAFHGTRLYKNAHRGVIALYFKPKIDEAPTLYNGAQTETQTLMLEPQLVAIGTVFFKKLGRRVDVHVAVRFQPHG